MKFRNEFQNVSINILRLEANIQIIFQKQMEI